MVASALPSGSLAKPNLPVLQRGHPLAQGLVGAWLFTESGAATANAGNQRYSINDWSDNRLTGLTTPASGGTLAVQWVDGLLGRAFLGPTVNNDVRVDITDARFAALLQTNEFSFAGWVRWDNLGANQFTYILTCPAYDNTSEPLTIRTNSTSIGGANPGVEITTFAAGNPWTSPLSSTVALTSAPVWFHFVLSFSKKRGTVVYYTNGKFDVSAAITASYSFSNSQPFCIGGAGPVINTRPWTGAIDSILMWNRGLNADDIRLLYSDHYAMFRVPSFTPVFKPAAVVTPTQLMGQIWLA